MCDAGQCVIELDGSIRTHFHLSFAFFMDSMPWIMSKTSGKLLILSIRQRMRSVICFALDGSMLKYLQTCSTFWTVLSRSNIAVVAYHRDDVGSVNFGLSIGVAADAVDLLDEVHVLLLRMSSFTLHCWMPVIVDSCLQPEYLNSMRSLVLRNEVEIRIDIKDGAQKSGILSFRMVLGTRIPSGG